MKKTIFQTGHGKGLARAEIEAVLGDVVCDEVDDGLVLELDVENAVALQNRLGGVVRITEVLHEGPAKMPLNFEEWIVKAMETEMKDHEGKIRYGLSMHPKSEKVLTKILQNSKKRLKEKLGNVRFVNKDYQNLSSVQAWHEKLLAPGAMELQLFQSSSGEEGRWYLTKTLSIQDFEWYSHRDYDRPARSAKNGMFPPKLAQELINLAIGPKRADPKFTIYDPFCGSGTVLQEAWLMGFSVQGSDLSMKCVADSKENLTWLTGEATADGQSFVFEKDALELTKAELPDGPFTLVSETTLGPALLKTPSASEVQQIQAELQALYDAFFKNLKKIVPKGTIMVFTAPYHRVGGDRLFLPHLPAILKDHCTIVPLSDHERPSLFFERKDQFVSREIWKVQFGK